MDPTVLVPLRDRGKSRLADDMTREGRWDLATAMLADVLTALASAGLTDVVVVAGGPDAHGAARALGARVIDDPGSAGGLDGALAAAGRGLTGPTLIVAADLPCLGASDLLAVLAADTEVVVAPTRDGGTGALLRPRPDAMATAYGPGSAARHESMARDAGLSVARIDAPGLAHDVDTRADLVDASVRGVGPATRALLDRWAPSR
jgi:2-phospho-L-lactate guanylyltransferase